MKRFIALAVNAALFLSVIGSVTGSADSTNTDVVSAAFSGSVATAEPEAPPPVPSQTPSETPKLEALMLGSEDISGAGVSAYETSPSQSPSPSPTPTPSLSTSPYPTASPGGKVAFLTFDDGPCVKGDSPTQNTAAILDILAKYNIKATFFVMGAHAKAHPDLILREFNEGHIIGNHTYSHVNPRTTDDAKFLRQVRYTNSILYKITGVRPQYFRTPFGVGLTGSKRSGLHMRVIGWDLDTLDWAGKSVDSILSKVEKAAKKGGKPLRILFHDRHAQGLEEVINLLLSYGYEFETIDHWSK